MRIAYITIENPNHRHSWSGTNYFILKTIREQIGEADVLGPIKPKLVEFIFKTFNFITLRLIRKRFDYRHSILFGTERC